MLISVTCTLGMAACDESVTVPESEPPAIWAFRFTQKILENAIRAARRKIISVRRVGRAGRALTHDQLRATGAFSFGLGRERHALEARVRPRRNLSSTSSRGCRFQKVIFSPN